MGGRLRALLVEDSPILREDLVGLLEELTAVEVVGAVTAEAEACRWLDSHTQACDIAIVDVFLQQGSGIGVLRHMTSYERPPERVVLTNYATPAMRQTCAQLGAAAVFDKSTEIDELVSWLEARGGEQRN